MQHNFIRKYWKKALLVVAALVLIILGGSWYIGWRWNKEIRLQLKSYVLDLSDSLYTLQYANLRLNALTGSLTIDKVSLVPDTAVYKRLQSRLQAPSLLYTVSADQVRLRFFKAWRYFRHKELSAGGLVLQNPSIVLELNSRNRDTTRRRNAYENLSAKIHSLYIGSLLLDNTNLKYTYIKKDSGQVVTQLHDLRIQVKDFLIDSVALQDPTRFLYARNYEFNLKDYRYRTPDSLYWMNVRDVGYSAAERTLRVGQFQVKPRYSTTAFDRQSGTQRDRFDVVLNDIEVQQLQPRLLLEQQVVWAQNLLIGNGTFNIYRNRNLPMPPGNKLGQFPHQLLQKLPVPVFIDSLVGKKTAITYTEINPKTQEAGVLQFRGVHGIFRNITNIDSMVQRNSHCIADLDALFMQSGKLRARFNFFLHDSTGGFAVSGQLKDMDGRDLNPVLRPLATAEVKNCRIEDLTFSMKGNEHSASGEVRFRYKDLKLNILKKEEGSHQYKKKGLMSLVANILVIKDSNPAPGEDLRVSHPHYQRDIKKSFFNLVWKTLFTGIKETAAGKNAAL